LRSWKSSPAARAPLTRRMGEAAIGACAQPFPSAPVPREPTASAPNPRKTLRLLTVIAVP